MSDIDRFIRKLKQPQNFTGLEINADRRPFQNRELNICLVYPDRYEIGMSHYGLKLLYGFLNRIPGVHAQRCFLPDRESLAVFERDRMPLFSLETKTPLFRFDAISFSLLSELNGTNVLQMLEMARLPLRTRDRRAEDPVIAGGGIALATNPEPLGDFFDLVGIGDGEVLFPFLIEILWRGKKKEIDRWEILRRCQKQPGFYVPSLTPTRREGLFEIPQLKGRTVAKQVMPRIDPVFAHQKLLVPFANAVFNRLDVELARGCPHNCRFCQAKPYYAPYRPADPRTIRDFITGALHDTGYDKVSFSTLSAGDYPDFPSLLEQILADIPPCVSFSVSSLKPSTVGGGILDRISLLRKTGLTIVPEAGTQRLRDIINKDLSEDQIMEAVDQALAHRWQRIKLYFMLGLPREEWSDIQGMAQLILRIFRRFCLGRGRNRINISFSAFVPKPHTPFERESREPADSLREKQEYLRTRIGNKRQIKYSFQDFTRGEVETVLTRGDRRVGNLIEDAWRHGEIFSAWDGEFRGSIWQRLMEDRKVKIFLNAIQPEQPLPWDPFEICYTPDHRRREAERARNGYLSPDCRPENCRSCQGCNLGPGPAPRNAGSRTFSSRRGDTARPPVFMPFRLFYSREGYFTCLSHLALMQYIERLIRQTRILFKTSGGFHPRMKLTSLQPLPVFAGSREEVVEVWLEARWTAQEVLARLNRVSRDLPFTDARKLTRQHPRLSRDIEYIDYRLDFPVSKDQYRKIEHFLDERDQVTCKVESTQLKIYHPERGSERFARILRVLDPEKKQSQRVCRQKIHFKNHERT